jgi:dihydroxyacetone kinase DhaKLM complex PTS-EIIA-like component DhaM
MGTSIIINGKNLNVPKQFFDVGVKASFEDNVQANLTTEDFTFVLQAYQEIKQWIEDGQGNGVGIFEGIPLTIVQSDRGSNATLFRGIIDLQNNTVIQENLKQITARLRQDQNLNQLDNLLEPLDYGYLKEIGVITALDLVNVDYVVNKVDNTLETITTLITVYLLSKQLADSIKELGTTIATISGIAASGITGGIGATIYSVATAILQVAYAATLLVLIIDFGSDLINNLVQPLRTHKGIKLKTLLSKACEHIGFNFNTTIDELENIIYLPSNQNFDQVGGSNILKKAGVITRGIPNPTDIGYTCNELFEICRTIFNARYVVNNGTVEFHSENSAFWLRNSTWTLPISRKNQAEKSFRYNTDELKSSILIQFQTDIVDQYTIKNYTGTSYQVLTDAKAVNQEGNKTITGLERVDIPYALGTRKDELNAFEKALLPLANLFDSIADVFGGRTNLAGKVKSRLGVLQVSDNNHAVPKLLYFNANGRIPSNQRSLFSARVLWDKYHNEKSFVENNFGRQRKYYEGVEVPFGLADFVALIHNSYFRDENGVIGKVTSIEWNFSKDKATINYWVQEIYTTNLKQTKIEPS